ncbi:MAG: helix-turn-helix domain-containing protein [Spirochaetota bacterium]
MPAPPLRQRRAQVRCGECRLDHAKKPIAGTSLPISRSAYSTGFNDANCFFRLFKKRFGMTPRNYRLRAGASPA